MTGLSRTISLAARAGVSTADILDQLKSCGSCPSYAVRKATKGDTSPGACCPGAVGLSIREMQRVIKGENVIAKPTTIKPVKLAYDADHKPMKQEPVMAKCPECKELGYVATGGCGTCQLCGYSKCS